MSSTPSHPPSRRPSLLVPGALVAVIVVTAILLVALSLGRPELATFSPSPPATEDVGGVLAGPLTYTVDARSPDRWVYFDFSRGSVVAEPGPLDWDLAFRRFHVMVNGGAGFPGQGGVQALDGIPLDSVVEAPTAGYQGSDARGDSVAPALARWYRYSWTSHLLTPEPRVYAVRTADGRYALMEIVGYYCPGPEPGCLTIRYRYQGSGEPRFHPSTPVDPPS